MSIEQADAQSNADPLLMDAGAGDDAPAADDQGKPPAGEPDADPAPAASPEDAPEEGDEEGSTEEDAGGEAADEPIEYTDFVAPEGVELDTEVLGTFKELAAEAKLPQEAAQKFVDLAAGLVKQQADAFQQTVIDTVGAWRTEAKADPEFGGTKLAENMKIAAKARDQFASPKLREFLEESRLGDHPEVLRLFINLGKTLSEDTVVQGGVPTPRPKLYTHPTSQAKSA